MLKRFVASFAAMLLAFAGCSDDRSGSDQPLPTWEFSPDPSVRIGAADGGEPSYLFHRVNSAQLLEDGRILVADGGNMAIRIFDSDGRFIREMGTTGEGPGEFREITGLWTAPDGTIQVYDATTVRVSRLRADGTFIGSHPLVQPPSLESAETAVGTVGLPPDLFIGAFSDGAIAAAWTRAGPRSSTSIAPDQMVMGWFDSTGAYVGSPAEFEGLRRLQGSPVPFTPFPHALIIRDTLYYSDGLRGGIQVVDREGNPLRTISPPLPAVEPRSAWDALTQQIHDDPEQFRAFLLPRVQTISRDYPIPQLSSILADDEGRLWIKAFDPRTDERSLPVIPLSGHGGTWWVVATDGTPLATVQMPQRVRPLAIRSGIMLGLHKDDLGVERIVLHQIRPS